MCNNFGINDKVKVKRLPEYYKDDIIKKVETFIIQKTENQEDLKEEMIKEWRQGDIEQLIYTRPLLEKYINKPRGRNGLK